MKRIVATNLTDLHAEPSWLAELKTQVMNGVPLDILEDGEKWCRVRQADGYEGWAFKAYLADHVEPTATHWVAATSTNLFKAPAPDAEPLTVLLCGTAIAITDAHGEWLMIKPAGDLLPAGWTHQSQLRPMRTLPPVDARAQIVADAKRLTGVYYLWGGASPFGIDCSGLVQLTHRLSGYTLPRDAYLQYAAARKVDAPFAPGDLLFFHGDTNRDRITHVGISLGGWEMIHSSRSLNGAYAENVQANDRLRATFVAAGAFIDRR